MRRTLALLGLIIAWPAHAAFIEYAFEVEVRLDGPPIEEFGLDPGQTFTGGFLLDDGSPRTAYSEIPITSPLLQPGVISSATYDISSMLLWVFLGDQVFTAAGNQLSIQDTPGLPTDPEGWSLTAGGDGSGLINGYAIAELSMFLRTNYSPLESSELQVTDASLWGYPDYGNRSFSLSFTNGFFVEGLLRSITPATTVPEPGTLSLLAAGALGAFAARRRRHLATKV